MSLAVSPRNTIDRYVKDFKNAKAELPPFRGVLFEEQGDGSIDILRWSGMSQPNVGPDGSTDIPDSAVSNGRVVLYADGIHTSMNGEETDIKDLLESDDPKRANVHQPVIGVQEGVGLDQMADIVRIGKDFEVLKGLQSGKINPEILKHLVFGIDPAVKTIHDEVRQSLEAGRDIQIALHSGGGAETAVALTLLQKEDGGQFAQGIKDRVRVLAVAGAAAPEDYEMAGVQPQNLYYTGSHSDPVFTMFHNYITPEQQQQMGSDIVDGMKKLLIPGNLHFHSPLYVFDHNVAEDGTSDIARYLNGAPGQIRTV